MQVQRLDGPDFLDLEITIDGRKMRALGPAGPARELALLDAVLPGMGDATKSRSTNNDSANNGTASSATPGGARTNGGTGSTETGNAAAAASATLPVLLGAGLGHALAALLERGGPLAVVDKEEALLAAADLRARFDEPRITWITDANPDAVLSALTVWQEAHGKRPFRPYCNPLYLRLDRPWYAHINEQLLASARFNFWDKAIQPRFRDRTARLLLITSKYFLMGEVVDACTRLGIPVELLTLENQEIGGADFVQRLLRAVVTFRPDCIVTLNHLGIDREGVLADLLQRLQVPLASWFVDNPHLIIHLYARLANPWTTIFTWDEDNLPLLHGLGFAHAAYLPLGTDPQRFRPRPGEAPPSALLPAQVCFVGNSMVYKVGGRLKKSHLPASLLRRFRQVATAYGASDQRSVRAFVLNNPEVVAAYQALPDDESRLAYETLLTWESTRQYRAACVEQILPFRPLLVGDRGWKQIFKDRDFVLHPEVTYYTDLPRVYPFCAVNFNCTSKQMKGAVNQRIFDVPAAGAFVLTDWREQMDRLFEPGKEIIAYHELDEIPELTRFYLANPAARNAIVRAGRRRVLAEHTWDHRIQQLIATMRAIYG